jgi:type II secretory pathway pseudopilin PulG
VNVVNHNEQAQLGFSYVEVLVAMTLIAVALIPAMNALRVGVSAASVHEQETVRSFALTGRMEQVLSQSFADLDAAAATAGSATVPTTYSDLAGTEDRLIVYIAGYDADNADADGNPFTGVDARVLWVQVVIENTRHALTTLVYDG